MATDFERLKHTVHGHSIMITSWYDDRLHVWKASAPDYAQMIHGSLPHPNGAVSREAAVAAVVNALDAFFGAGA